MDGYETLLSAPPITPSGHWDRQSNWQAGPSSAPSHWRGAPRSRLWCQPERLDQDSMQPRLICGRIADLVRWREPSLFKSSGLAFLGKKKIRVQVRKGRRTVHNIQETTSEVLLAEIALMLDLDRLAPKQWLVGSIGA